VLIKKFDGHSELVIQEQVAKAMINKGIRLGQTEQPEEEIATYDALIEKFDGHSKLAIQEQVAKAVALKRIIPE